MNKDDIQKYVSYKIAYASLDNLLTRNDNLGNQEKSALSMAMTVMKDKISEIEVKLFGGDNDK